MMRELFLIIHFIGLAMGVGTSFAYLFLGIASSKLPVEERGKFMLNTLSLRRMGEIGLALLVVSGLYLITPYWRTLGNMPTLIAKLTLVIILASILIYSDRLASKAHSADAEKYLPKIRSIGPIIMLITLSILVLAVYTFH